jgi:hypothetical protein
MQIAGTVGKLARSCLQRARVQACASPGRARQSRFRSDLDNKLSGFLGVLMKLVRELQVTYEQYLDVRRPDSGFTEPDDFDRDARKVLWAKPTGDDLRKRLLASIKKIEDLTRKYL